MLEQLNFRGKELFRKEKNQYEVFEITPSRYIDPAKALEEVLNQMTACYEGNLRWNYETKSFVYSNSPIYYEILYSEGKIHFNYVLPHKYSKIITRKIDKIFRVAGINQKEDYFPKMFGNTQSCSFHQSRHFMFSLSTDIKETGLLDGLMSIVDNLEKTDNVLLQIGIAPQEDHWKAEWLKANQRFKAGDALNVQGSILLDAVDKTFKIGDSFFNLVDSLLGVDTKKKETSRMDMQSRRFEMMGNTNYRHAHMTTAKVNWNGYLVSIKVFCDNSSRTKYYSRLFNAAFRILDADQELRIGDIKGFKSKERVFDSQIFDRNIWSCKELSQFLRLPDRRMQLDYKSSMKSIEVTENPIPEELLSGKIKIGDASYKGVKIPVYYPEEYAMKAMPKVLVGPMRAGKTEKLKHFIIEAIKSGNSVICIDTIKSCEVVEDVRDYMPEEFKDKLVILDYSNIRLRLPLAFNELVDVKFVDHIDEMMAASHLTGSLIGFVNAVSGFDDELTPKMKRNLSVAGKVVLSQKNSTIKNVFDVLEECDIREQFIQSSGLPESNSMIQQLRLLDDGKGGTNYSMVSGILDRASAIMNDYCSEILLSTPSNPEINFTKFANEGKCVLIKMSENVFDREALRPLVTFLYFKIWLAVATARANIDKPKMCFLVLDEIHQYPEIATFLSSKAKESAKFGLSYMLTSHYLPDMKRLLPNLKSAGTNFILLGGTSKENYKLLETELMQGDVNLEEAMQTKPFYSLNIINYNRKYAIFTTKSYPEWKKCGWLKKVDRSRLDLEHSKKYGVPFEG